MCLKWKVNMNLISTKTILQFKEFNHLQENFYLSNFTKAKNVYIRVSVWFVLQLTYDRTIPFKRFIPNGTVVGEKPIIAVLEWVVRAQIYHLDRLCVSAARVWSMYLWLRIALKRQTPKFSNVAWKSTLPFFDGIHAIQSHIVGVYFYRSAPFATAPKFNTPMVNLIRDHKHHQHHHKKAPKRVSIRMSVCACMYTI